MLTLSQSNFYYKIPSLRYINNRVTKCDCLYVCSNRYLGLRLPHIVGFPLCTSYDLAFNDSLRNLFQIQNQHPLCALIKLPSILEL